MKKQSIRELMVRGEKARKQIFFPLLSDLGLTPGQGQAKILYHLQQEDRITQKELADRCRIDAAAMSRNIDKLEGLGLLVRESNPDCRRSFSICLTEKGYKEAMEIRKVFEQFEEIVSEGISQADIDVFYRVMEKMCVNLERYNDRGSEE
ncbi:MarR family winged helix-turn-helix transcriptional regulator [Lacrimispora sp. AGF001]|uniref:MarR family winged helix-turn-helix transcriptional regulator n=1 Tax=Lacrimispora sp. AGF001 TaxID=3401631 RepID=UPI003B42F72F|nr:MarR family transcriptional regulator [Paenibacillaceae bacterium]